MFNIILGFVYYVLLHHYRYLSHFFVSRRVLQSCRDISILSCELCTCIYTNNAFSATSREIVTLSPVKLIIVCVF